MLEKIKQNIETQAKALNVNVFFGTAESIFAEIETKSKLNSNEKRDVFPALFVNSDYSLKNRVVKLNVRAAGLTRLALFFIPLYSRNDLINTRF